MAGDAPSPGQSPGQTDNPQHTVPAAPLALYRRYRPATFAEVKGQDHVTEPLRQALLSGRVHHAYLFSGPRGCGKTSSARILARSLNCEQGPTPDPCGKCPSCIALAPAGPGSIDVIEIDAASHGGVDDARDLRERAFYSPVSGRFKIYIIDEAHMVTREGFNALLKLVEEPPPHLKFVFATTEPEKVIATIKSRTHHYPFRLAPPAVLREHLEQILAAEGVRYEPAVLPIVVRAGAGSFRDALSVLDQLLAGADESGLRYDKAIALLGYTDDRLLDEVVEAFAAGDGAAVFHAVDHVMQAGHDPRRFATDLLDRLRDLIVISAVPDAAQTGLIDVPADRVDQMNAQAAAFGQTAITRAAEVISAGLVEMRGATSPRLLLELMCAQVLLPSAAADPSALVQRLDELERKLAAVRQEPAQAQPARPDSGRPETGRTEPARSRPAAADSAGAPSAAAPAADRSHAPAGTDDIRSRWPDVLEALSSKRKVAWIQLKDASVESFADGVLTLAFAQPGFARGFQSGGYDKDLGQVLAAMFGITPQIRTTVLTGNGPNQDLDRGTGQSGYAPARQNGATSSQRPADGGGRPSRSSREPTQQSASSKSRSARSSRSSAPADEPDPSDQTQADALSGLDLIERELGGRVIEETGGP